MRYFQRCLDHVGDSLQVSIKGTHYASALSASNSQKRSSSIVDYFHRFQTLSDALAIIGQPLNEFEQVSFLLAGRGSNFGPFVTSITTKVEPLSVDEIYGHLHSHEMRLEQHQTSLDLSVAGANFPTRGNSPQYSSGHGMRGSSDNSSSGRSYSIGASGPYRGRSHGASSSHGFPSSNSQSNRPLCQVCNRFGHVALDYYNRFNESYSRE
jgi:hypothetical protein